MNIKSAFRFTLLALGLSPLGIAIMPAAADQVFNDDVIVIGSLCVGMDCVNGENFGFDTIRLKENNLRINFQDTSNSASFPSNDWRIVANDTTNGGANYLAIEDSTAGRQPFRVNAGAPANSLFVASSGNIGAGTSTPVVQMHIVDGNTPTLRLEQNGSSGFTPQTWDVAGNEAGFFVRDATNASALPFRILPGVSSDFLVLAGNERVGIGAGTNPAAKLHIRSTDGTTQLLVDEASGTPAVRELFKMTNNGGSFYTMENTESGDSWFFLHQDNMPNSFLMRHSGDSTVEFNLNPNGNLIIGGALTENSDRNNKTDIVALDENEILKQVGELDISEWSYKNDVGTRHIGPMAQDFYALFGTGASEKGISTIDTGGVALASIKALYVENQELKARLDALEERIAN